MGLFVEPYNLARDTGHRFLGDTMPNAEGCAGHIICTRIEVNWIQSLRRRFKTGVESFWGSALGADSGGGEEMICVERKAGGDAVLTLFRIFPRGDFWR
jgi:hypothetical protein